MNEVGIAYSIRGLDLKQKFNIPLSLKENKDKYCISENCVTIWNGKIARCPQVMYIDYFNKYFNISFPREGVLELENSPEREDLKLYLKQDIPLCKHCVKNEIDWQVCGKEVLLSDFVKD